MLRVAENFAVTQNHIKSFKFIPLSKVFVCEFLLVFHWEWQNLIHCIRFPIGFPL